MGAHRRSTGFRRVGSIISALALAGAGIAFLGAPAQAASPCPIPGNFEIDGDMTQATCTPAGDDWNTPGIAVQSTNQGGTYKTAGKDDADPSGWQSSGSTPDKTNFEQAYATSRVVGGHFYVFVAWERTDTSGTQGYAIEIDNSGANVGGDGTPQPNRSNGGAVFYISSVGSGSPTFDSACSFTSQSNYGTTCTSSNASITTAINTASISDPLRGTTQVAGSFFETALDITALTGIEPSCPGASAASVYLRSITGQTHNGNLKGYMAPLSVAPDSTCVAPPISTTASGNGNLNAPGSSQSDSVTVGTGQAPGVGSVDFFLCSPSTVTTNGGDCSTGGTKVGATKPLDGSGQATSDNASGAATTAVGTYCWRAEFTPSANDHNYLPGSHTNKTTECFTISHATPKISTQIAVTGDHSPGLGFTTLGDTAQLTDFVPGTVTGENVSFKLYGPYVTIPATCTNDTPVFTTTGALNASGAATTSGTYDPTAAGKYVWVASYAGNSFNDPVSGACDDANESVNVVGAQVDVAKSANPPGPVSAGEKIGFDLTVTNDGAVPAKGVHVHDTLPVGADGVANGDLNWALDPAYTDCAISGAVGSQVLDCDFTQVDGPGSLPVIHISATTSPADCGTVKNKATITTTNGTGTDSDVATVTVLCPHLAISKTADDATVNVGSQIGFTVTATNDGQGTASGVLVNDPLPAGSGINWTIATSTGPLTCSIDGNPPTETLKCTGSLNAAASETVHVVSGTSWDADHNSCGTYSNTATVSADNVNNAPNATASTDVLCPDLDLAKKADADNVNAGTDIGFTITAHNTGDGAATGAVINDPLPAGVTWTIDDANTSGPLDCGIDNNTLTCTGTLAAGATQIVHITAPTSFLQCGTYDNTATLTASNTPQAPEGEDTTHVLCADVVVQKAADDSSVDVGDDIGFSVTISNNGSGQALGVDVEDPLPGGQGVHWSIDGSTGPLNCAITGAPDQTLSCTGDLDATGQAGDTQTVHITSSTVFNADLNSCGTYDNTATLTWNNGPDATISSNEATTQVLCPNLTFTKTADADSVSAGDPIGFSIEVANSGNGTAKGVEIHDPLPAPTGSDVTWGDVVVTGDGANVLCSINGAQGAQTLDCTLGDVGIEFDAVIHVSAQTTPQSCAAYDNTATLTTTNAPGKESSASTAVLCPDPALTKVADADTVTAGDQIGFTVTASNGDDEGTGTAKGVEIDDPLPGGDGISWGIDTAPDNCAITDGDSGQTLHCDAVDLGPGDSEVIHVVSDTTNDSCATYDNTATLTATNADDLTASASVEVNGCVIVTPPTPTPSPLPPTGTSVTPAMLLLDLGLLTLGGLLVLYGRRRSPFRGMHAA
ncbi:DUF11 domain-containing protein [Nocardioides marmorisolisilvae]|uniref:DUF11 domain-containing protein n=1 Tax=Nocardioides marmorisolisilvae TaxID=1542737 RepID=A0A3N0DX00_9ACTN|nr:DUF11 domain-containing protein [Nocardioides marmorisolisilvae]RNL80148.1 DUF11 domain-containing protein [Nocardioides marmorisolisilvae]